MATDNIAHSRNYSHISNNQESIASLWPPVLSADSRGSHANVAFSSIEDPLKQNMDKALAVGDATSSSYLLYVQDLQKKPAAVEDDILITREALSRDEGALNCVGDAMPSLLLDLSPRTLPEHKILELDVCKIEEQTFHLKIHCKETPGVLVQLTSALEALDSEITNAIVACVSGHILNTVVVKLNEEEVLEVEDLKTMLLEVASKFGLCLG